MTDGPGSARGHDLVRPFVMTRGRTRVERRDLRFETLVRASGPPVATLPSEQRDLVARSQEPISVAELAVQLDLVIGVVSVLVNDLLDAGLVEVFDTHPDDIELEMLTKMFDKIRSL